MYVNVYKARRENGFAKINYCGIRRSFPVRPRTDRGDDPILNKNQRVQNFFLRGIKTMCGENDHRRKNGPVQFNA